ETGHGALLETIIERRGDLPRIHLCRLNSGGFCCAMGNESKSERPTRREVLLGAGAWSLMQAGAVRAFARQATAVQMEPSAAQTSKETAIPKLPHARPAMADRKFTSPAVEDAIVTLQRQIADPALR